MIVSGLGLGIHFNSGRIRLVQAGSGRFRSVQVDSGRLRPTQATPGVNEKGMHMLASWTHFALITCQECLTDLIMTHCFAATGTRDFLLVLLTTIWKVFETTGHELCRSSPHGQL